MKIEFKVTRSESKAASRAIEKLQPKISWLKTVNFFGSMLWAFLITIGLITVLKRIPSIFRYDSGFTLGLGAIVVGVLIFFALRYYVKRTYLMKAGIYGSYFKYELLNDRIVSWINDNIKVEIMPSAIIQIIQYGGFILIFTGKAYAYYIPKYAFNTDTELDKFVKALEQMIES